MYVQDTSLRKIAAGLRAGEMPLQTYLRQSRENVEAVEPHVEALLPEPDRWERLCREAAALRERYPNPESRPPLYGVLVGVKDSFRADGFETRVGSALPPELFAGPEAPTVTALKQAGALILGKTVTTEFTYFEPGPTRNPHRITHTPGGSSSGSAAAVAAGYCPLALGTQTVGSIIRPAAFCGVVGFKPSYQRLSAEGLIPYSHSVDHPGFFVPQPDDLEPAARVLLPNFQAAGVPDGVLAVPEGPYLVQTEPDALTAFYEQIARLEAAGWAVRRMSALADITEINHRHNRLAAAELAETHREWFPRHEALYRPRTAAWIREGQQVSPEEIESAREGRFRFRAELEAMMRREKIVAWLSPAATGPAPEGIAFTGNPIMNLPWTYAGLPVASVPAGTSTNGLPLGLQIAGSFGQDETLIALATALGHVYRSRQD